MPRKAPRILPSTEMREVALYCDLEWKETQTKEAENRAGPGIEVTQT
jgi:hypothetical protein